MLVVGYGLKGAGFTMHAAGASIRHLRGHADTFSTLKFTECDHAVTFYLGHVRNELPTAWTRGSSNCSTILTA